VGSRKKKLRTASAWLNASIVGIQFPVAMAIGYFWGKWMDDTFGTHPWQTIVFFLCGTVAGFVNLFRITAAAERQEQRLSEEQDESNGDPGPS
jgi:F0F1-type ATP synthase assembly protein I